MTGISGFIKNVSYTQLLYKPGSPTRSCPCLLTCRLCYRSAIISPFWWPHKGCVHLCDTYHVSLTPVCQHKVGSGAAYSHQRPPRSGKQLCYRQPTAPLLAQDTSPARCSPLFFLSIRHLPNILSWLITPWIVKNTQRDCEVSTHMSIPRLAPFTPWCTSPFGRTMKLRMSPLLRTGKARYTTQYSLRSRRKSGSAGSSFVRKVLGSQEVMPNERAP